MGNLRQNQSEGWWTHASRVGIRSLIRESLWDKARWRGVGVAVAPNVPPWLILGFENAKPAAEILTHLVRDIGTEDPENRLRITIVRGISKKNPFHYRVVVGSNVDKAGLKKFSNMMFRVHTMEPTSSVNLDRFIASYEQVGSFLLGIGAISPTKLLPPEPMRHGHVHKRQIQIREAWEIGLNDTDGSGVLPDDDVFIPEAHAADAPVLKLLQWKHDKSEGAGRTRSPRTSKRKPANKRKEKLKSKSRKRNRR